MRSSLKPHKDMILSTQLLRQDNELKFLGIESPPIFSNSDGCCKGWSSRHFITLKSQHTQQFLSPS